MKSLNLPEFRNIKPSLEQFDNCSDRANKAIENLIAKKEKTITPKPAPPVPNLYEDEPDF